MKVIAVVFAGRKRYLEILIPYLLKAKNKKVVSECYLCLNTKDHDDVIYINELEAKYPDFFKVKRLDIDDAHDPWAKQGHVWHKFYSFTTDPNSVYVKFDDTICWMEEDAIEKLVAFRLANPHPFLISANLVNNGICNHIHQRLGTFPSTVDWCGYNHLDSFSWGSGRAAEIAHNALLSRVNDQKLLNEYKFTQWVLLEYTEISINCISWFGRDMVPFSCDDGPHLTVTRAAELGRPCTIYGGAVFSHFAFYTQREFLEKNTGLLEQYKLLALK